MLRQFPLYTDEYTEYEGSIFINLFVNVLKMNEHLDLVGRYEYNNGVPSWNETDRNFFKRKCAMIKKRYNDMYDFLDDGEHILNVEFVTEWLHCIENYIDLLLFYERIYESDDNDPICFESDDNSTRWINVKDYKVEIEMTVIENPSSNSIISSKKEKYLTFYRIYYKNNIILDIMDNDTIDSNDNNLEFEDALIITECVREVSHNMKLKLNNIFHVSSKYTNNIDIMLEMDSYIETIDKEEIKKNVSDGTKRDNNRSSHFRSPFWIFRSKDSV
jgi:hypothetical protein